MPSTRNVFAIGLRQPTITRYVWRTHHIPAVQVELSAWLRIVERLPQASNAKSGIAPHFRGDGQRILRAYCTLRDFIGAWTAAELTE